MKLMRPPVKRQRLNDDVEAAAAHSLVYGLEKQHYLHATASDDWEWLPGSPDSAEGVLRFGTATPVPAELLGRWTGTSAPAVPKAAGASGGAEAEGILRWAYGGSADLPSAGASQAALVRALATERSLSAFANTERAGVSESVAFVLAIVAGGALASTRGVYRGPSPDASEVTYFALLPRVPEVAAVSATSDAVVSAIVRSVQTGALGNQRDAVERYLKMRGFALAVLASDPPASPSSAAKQLPPPAHQWTATLGDDIAIECGFDDAGRLVALKNRSPCAEGAAPAPPAPPGSSAAAAAATVPGTVPAVEEEGGTRTIKVTPEQSVQLRRIFAKFDADGDGVLNFQEANALQMQTEEDDEGYDYDTFTWICHMFDVEPVPGLALNDIVRLYLDESLPFEADLAADFAKLFPDG